jgi:hypothetical protein
MSFVALFGSKSSESNRVPIQPRMVSLSSCFGSLIACGKAAKAETQRSLPVGWFVHLSPSKQIGCMGLWDL